jgi:CRP-like cAMP-binding protein
MSVDQLFNIFLDKNSLYTSREGNSLYGKLQHFLLPLITTSYYPRSQLILSAGQVADYLYFLEEGLARGFYFDQDKQKEVTVFIWKECSIVMVPESFYDRKRSAVYIEVIAGSRMLCISWYQLMEFVLLYPEASVILQNLILQFSEYENKRNRHLSLLSAWERYLQLLDDFPAIEQRVSKEVIASYLNITPQSLSRMLRKKRHP